MKKNLLIVAFVLMIGSFPGLMLRHYIVSPYKTVINKTSVKRLPGEYIRANQNKIDILHYGLEFDLYPEEKKLIASAELTGRILDYPLSSIDLNFYDNFDIKKVLLNGKESGYFSDGTNFSIPLSTEIPDTFVVKILYEGSPERAGLDGFVFGKRDSFPLAYTLSEPTYASSWFPCNDIPSDKTLLDMKITNDSSMISVSNGILVGEEIKGNRKTYHWKTIYPISTYLIALYSGDYEMFQENYVSVDGKDTMGIVYYVLPDKLEKAKIDFSVHSEILKYFAETFGEYPFIKEKYGVAEFLWSSGAMENQTITGVSSRLIGGKKFFTDYLVHELAHHWWGNAVGLKSWNEIWLNEGFASYSEALYFEFKGGSKALQSTMRNKYYENFSGKLSEPGPSLFTNTVYNKGAWVLHMLRWEVGDSAFFKILREYFEEYKYSNASTSDFRKICERISGLNLKSFFNQWIDGEGEIELLYRVKTEKKKNIYETEIEIEQVQEDFKSYKFPIGILLKFENGVSENHRIQVKGKVTKFRVNNSLKPEGVELDPDKWLLATIKEK